MNDIADDSHPSLRPCPPRGPRRHVRSTPHAQPTGSRPSASCARGRVLFRARHLRQVPRHARSLRVGQIVWVRFVGQFLLVLPGFGVARRCLRPRGSARAGALAADGGDHGLQLPGAAVPAPRSDGHHRIPGATDGGAACRPAARRVGRLAQVRCHPRRLRRRRHRRAPGRRRHAPGVRARVRRHARLRLVHAADALPRGLRPAARHAVLFDVRRHLRDGTLRRGTGRGRRRSAWVLLALSASWAGSATGSSCTPIGWRRRPRSRRSSTRSS